MYGMLSGKREGRARKVYSNTVIWGAACAIVNPVIFEIIYPQSLAIVPLIAFVSLVSLVLFYLSKKETISDSQLFFWIGWYFYLYSFHLGVTAFINDFHLLHFVSLLFGTQLCSLSYRSSKDSYRFVIIMFSLTIVAIFFHPNLDESSRINLIVLMIFGFFTEYLLSGSKTNIINHMRLHRDVLVALSQKTENALFITSMNGIIVDLNVTALSMLSYKEEDLINRDFSILRKVVLTPDEIENGLGIINQNKFWSSEADLVCGNGDIIHAYISIGMVEQGGMRFLVYRVRNKTEEIKTHQALVAARDAAQAAVKTKSDFVAIMSHEIRTPLNGVLGMAQLLEQTKLDERQQDYVHTILKSGKSLMILINDILDFSKMESGKTTLSPINIDLRDKICEVADLLRPHAESKGLVLAVNISMDVPDQLILEGSRLQQVLLNLIGNSIKFTEKGSVTIHCKSKKLDNARADLCIEIEDTGIGIPADKIDHLFDSFSQVDSTISRRYGGTGLGLAISKQVIELMGGSILVESKIDVGSKFIVHIPEIEVGQGNVSDQIEGNNWDSAYFENDVILIAEDNTINQKVIQYMLQNLGLRSELVSNGAEVLEYFKEKETRLVLMDMQMPIMDGIEATRKLREQNRNTYIIAMTANHSEEDKRRCLECGMDDFVSKPFAIDQVKSALMRWKQAS
ncbi:MAG: ATP-binding protein [Flavobacteriales bacterium]|jgi:PAS domain S-box-containing protein